MPSVDALKYSLSHFDNSDIWFEASYDLNNKTGWLGRWIERYGNDTNPLQAISIDTALSKSIRTTGKPVCAINSLPVGGLQVGAVERGRQHDRPQRPDQPARGHRRRQRERVPQARPLDLRPRLQHRLAGQRPGRHPDHEPVLLSDGQPGLSIKLRTAASLIKANLGTRVITIHWGGFDTHTLQVKNQDVQLKELSRALGAFQAELEAGGLADRVSTLIFSEFGRRVKETPNSAPDVFDAGTDHGAGGLMLAVGKNVKGGLASEWPGCRPADLIPGPTVAAPNEPNAQGNLRVMTDFRSVYQSVLQEWLGDPRRHRAAAARAHGGRPGQAIWCEATA